MVEECKGRRQGLVSRGSGTIVEGRGNKILSVDKKGEVVSTIMKRNKVLSHRRGGKNKE